MKKIIMIIMTILICIPTFIHPQWHNIDLGTKNELTDIYFLNDSLGFCIGNGSLLFVTENRGKLWEYRNIDDRKRRLNKITFITEIGLILGEGIIYRATDRGLIWEPVYSDSSINFADLDFYSPNKIWLYGGVANFENWGVIYESNDIGATWHKILDTEEISELKGKRIHAAKLISETSALILCTGSIDPLGPTYIYKTTNNGIDWNYYSENIHYTWGLSGSDSDTLWAWGGGLELSIDSGKTWNYDGFKLIKEDGSLENLIVETVIDLNISENSIVSFLEAKYDQYSIFINKESPMIWERIYVPSTTRLTSMFFINHENIWCVGLSGTLITNNDIFSSVKKNTDSEMNANFSVLGNYPNPFNSATRIRYDVNFLTYLTLSLCDLTGQRVILFQNKYHSKGDYFFEIDSERLNLSSGIYIYSLSDLKNLYSYKLLLIK